MLLHRLAVTIMLGVLTIGSARANEIAIGDAVLGPDLSAYHAATARNGVSGVAIWRSSEGRLLARAFDLDGRPSGETHLVALGVGRGTPSIVWIGDRYRVVWISTDHRYEILSRHLEIVDLDREGRMVDGSRRRITSERNFRAFANRRSLQQTQRPPRSAVKVPARSTSEWRAGTQQVTVRRPRRSSPCLPPASARRAGSDQRSRRIRSLQRVRPFTRLLLNEE